MRKIGLILLSILLLNCNSTDSTRKPKSPFDYIEFKNDLESNFLTGKVSKITIERANINNGKSTNQVISRIMEFDNDGFLINDEYFDNYGKLSESHLTLEYSDSINFIEHKFKNRPKSDYIEKRYFDENEYLKKIVLTKSDSVFYSSLINYDSINNVTTTIEKQNGITSIIKTIDKLDKNDYIIEQIQLKDSNQVSITTNEYDKKSRLILQKIDSKFFKLKQTYRYDKDGFLIEKNDFENGKIKEKTKFDYFFNPILKVYYDNGIELKKIKTDYQYDKNGNWIWSQTYITENSEFIPAYNEYRQIEYY